MRCLSMKVSSRRLDMSLELREVWAGVGRRGVKNWCGGTRVSELVVFRGLGAGDQNDGHGTVIGNSTSKGKV